MVNRGVGVGLVLTAVSLGLILIGDAVAWVASWFNYSAGESTGSSLAGMGELIIAVLVTILVIVAAVWVYDRMNNSGGI